MHRDYSQRGILKSLIGAADEVMSHDDVVAQIRSVESGVEDAAIGKASVQDHGSRAQIAKQEVEIGRVKGGKTFLRLHDEIALLDLSDELVPARPLDGVLVRVGDGTNIEGEDKPPGGLQSVHVVNPALSENASNMNDWDSCRSASAMKRVNGLHDLPRARRGTRASRTVVEMTAMKVDRDDCSLFLVEKSREIAADIPGRAIDIGSDVHY